MNKLHIITNRISTAITQQPSLKKNIIKDFKFLFYRHNRVILFLVNLKVFFAFLLQKPYFCSRFTGRGALT